MYQYIWKYQPSNQNANGVIAQLKSNVEESIDLKVLNVPFICRTLKNQPIKITQKEFENLREIYFADAGEHYDIDLLIGSNIYIGHFCHIQANHIRGVARLPQA